MTKINYFFMFEEMAVNYFRGLEKSQKKALIKKIFAELTEQEKLEIAKMLLGKKK